MDHHIDLELCEESIFRILVGIEQLHNHEIRWPKKLPHISKESLTT